MDRPAALLVWYRNAALPTGSDLCFAFEPEGDPVAVAAQISDMHASGTTLSPHVSVEPLEANFSLQEIRLLNQLLGLEHLILHEQDQSIGRINDLFRSLMEKGAEIALRHQAEGG